MAEEKYSLTWAANNAIMLVPFGFADSTDALLPSELREHMKGLPVYITEHDGKRINRAFNDLVKEKTFWTVDCQLVSSAEGLVRESKANATVADVITSLGDKAQALPQGTILFNMDVSSMMRDSVELEFEPIEIRTSESLRRVDIHWGARTPDQWTRIDELINRQYAKMAVGPVDQRIQQHLDEATRGERRTRGSNTRLWIAAESVSFVGNDRYCGSTSYYRTFLRGDVRISHYLRRLAVGSNDIDAIRRLNIFSTILVSIIDHRDRAAMAAARLRRLRAELGEDLLHGTDEFLDALNESPGGLFDTSAWAYRDQNLGD